MTYDSGAGGANLKGRLASVTDPSGFVEYSYDAAGNLRSVTYPTGHTVDYQPDSLDPALIQGVALDSAALASSITYAPFGPATAMTLANGIQVSRSYDKNYQVRTMAAGTVLDRTYTPDAVGNIELITDNLDSTRSQSFGYDALYRLTNATGIYGAIDFTYDKVGNRLTRNRTGASPANDSYHYLSGTNLLRDVAGTHTELIKYDADGNTKTRTPGANNPVPTITDPADYVYNSSGQRQMKQNSADRIFHYDLSGKLIAETDGLGTLVKAYVWLHGQPLAQFDAGGNVSYYINDHLGTPQRMTDGVGSVVWAADYLPFGLAQVTVEIVENNLRFPGQFFDKETGLHYNWNRYYDPKLGRYLRADPIGLAGGINPYVYANANPINWVDPDGLLAGPALGIAVAVGGGVGLIWIEVAYPGAIDRFVKNLISPDPSGGGGGRNKNNTNGGSGCDEIIRDINSVMKGLHRRYLHQCRDKKKQWDSHKIAFDNEKLRLGKLVREAEKKGCVVPPKAYIWLKTESPLPGTPFSTTPGY